MPDLLDDAGFRIFENIILKSQTNVFGKEFVMENVIGVAMIILNIVGLVWLGIKLGHSVLIPLGYIIALIIIGNINEDACLIVALAVATIVLIVIIVTVVKAIIEKKWLKELARKNTDLVNAINRSDKQAVQAIIENGAYIDYIDYNNYSRYPLQIAIENSDKEMVAFLIEKGANVNLICGEKAPLDFAKGDEMITLLKRHGAKSQREQDNLNHDLVSAIGSHNIEQVELLISQGADVNIVLPSHGFEEVEGVTPLMLAVHVNDIDIVKLLVKKGADIKKKVYLGIHEDQDLYADALEFAEGRKYMEIVNFLEHPWG